MISPSLWGPGISLSGRRRLGPDRTLTCRLKYFSSSILERYPQEGWQNNLPDEIGLPLK